MTGGRPHPLAGAGHKAWTWWAAAGVGQALGLTAYQVGSGSREFNILAPPALALILWSLLIYFTVFVRRLMGGRGAAEGGVLVQWMQKQLAWVGRQVRKPDEGALRRDLARASAHLHVMAAGVAAGVVAGIYLRGLVVEYSAVWESTFLSAEQVAAVLRCLLGPASLVTGIALPSASEIEQLRTGGEAATWLHLWAVTVLLYCLLPRVLLAALQARQAFSKSGQAEAARPVGATGAVPLAIIAYCLPEGGVRARQVASEVAHLLHAPENPRVLGMVPYGEEDSADSLLNGAPGAAIALLVGAGTTPEAETHGAMAAKLEGRPPGTSIVLDSLEWHRRGLAEPARLAARLEAWRNIIPETIPVVVLGAMCNDIPQPSQ